MKIKETYFDHIDLLEGEYKETFQRINIYIAASEHDEDVINSIMSEILDLFLSAQTDSVNVNHIIGDDYELFCNQMMKEHRISLFQKSLAFFKAFRYYALFLCITETLSLLSDYFDGVVNPWNVNFQMSGISIVIAISFVIPYLFNITTKKLVFKFDWYTQRLNLILSVIIFNLIIILILLIPENIIPLIAVPRYIIISSSLMFFIIMTMVKKKEKKEQEVVYIDLSSMIYESVYDETIKQNRKEYERYLKKCNKKQRTPLDSKSWYERKYQKDHIGDVIGKGLFIVLVIAFVIEAFMTSTFINAMIFTVILVLIESFIYKYIDKERVIRGKLYYKIKEKDTDIYDDTLYRNSR